MILRIRVVNRFKGFSSVLWLIIKSMRQLFLWLLFFLLVACSTVYETRISTEVASAPQDQKIYLTHTPTQKSTPEIKRPTITPKPSKVITVTHTKIPNVVSKICSPLAEHTIESLPQIVSSPYDPPPMGKDERHQGVDFAYYNQLGRDSIEGEGVTSILSGWIVANIENRLPYGNMVILETPRDYLLPVFVEELEINDGESLYHLYAHLGESPLFVIGEWVDCGAIIGSVGATGYNVPVPHLHLETRIGPSGYKFDGMAYYDAQATEYEMETYELWRMSGLFRHFDPMLLFGGTSQ